MLWPSAISFAVLSAMLWLSLATFMEGGALGLVGAGVGLIIGLRERKERFWAAVTGAMIGVWIGLGLGGLG